MYDHLVKRVGTWEDLGPAPKDPTKPGSRRRIRCTICQVAEKNITVSSFNAGRISLCDCQKESSSRPGLKPGRPPRLLSHLGETRTLPEWAEITGVSYAAISNRYGQRRRMGLNYPDSWVIFGGTPDMLSASAAAIMKHGVTADMDVEHIIRHFESSLKSEIARHVENIIRVHMEDKLRPTLTRLISRATTLSGAQEEYPIQAGQSLPSAEPYAHPPLSPAAAAYAQLVDPAPVPPKPDKSKNENLSKKAQGIYCADPDPRDAEPLYKNATFRQVREQEGDAQAEKLWNVKESANLLETEYWAFMGAEPAPAKSAIPKIGPFAPRPQYRRLLNGLEFIKLTPILKAKHCPKTPHRNLMPVVRDLTSEPWDMDRTRDLWFYEKAHVIDYPDALLPPPGWEIVPSVDSFTAKPKATPPWFAKFVPGYKSWPKGYVPGVWPNQKHVPSFTEEEEALICEAPWWAWRIKGGLQGEIPGGAFPVSQYDRLAAWAHYAAEGPPFGEGPHDEPKNGRIKAYLGVDKYDWCVDCRTLALAMDFNWAWFWIYQNFRLVPPAGNRWDETLEALFPRIRRWQASHVRYVREAPLQIILNTLHKSAREDFAQLLGFDDAYALFSRDLSIVPYEEHEEVFLDAEDLRLPLGSQDLRLAISAGPDLLKAYEYEQALMESDEWPPLYPSHFLNLEDTPSLW